MNLKEDFYQKANSLWWAGRKDGEYLRSYFHELVEFVDAQFEEIPILKKNQKGYGLIGYCCQEGVRRNHGRIGAAHGPRAIRNMLAPLANHLEENIKIIDFGNLHCLHEEMETTQQLLGNQVFKLLERGYIPLLMGGGHDIAYGHYLGLKLFLDNQEKNKSLGIINLDAHFDLRNSKNGTNSGTPFFEIALDTKNNHKKFNYLCLGIQKTSNTRLLFNTANDLEVDYVLSQDFHKENMVAIREKVSVFIDKVDYIYLTMDLDGFSSAYAPGVSASSPYGFSPEAATEVIKFICNSKKLISSDIAELNPTYDQDNCTARLASGLLYSIMQNQEN
ncbi:MAG: formiminoglutamase [Bacteroidia bacterium]|jgi:formiminoglutamase